MTESFPRQEARTRRFTLGYRVRSASPRTAPGSPSCAATAAPTRSTCLWVLDVDSGQEHLVADPSGFREGTPGRHRRGRPAAAERARRERVRESAGGIVAYATDQDGTVAAFALSGQRVHGAADRRARRGPREVATRTPAPGSAARPGRAAAGLRLRRRAAGDRPGRRGAKGSAATWRSRIRAARQG